MLKVKLTIAMMNIKIQYSYFVDTICFLGISGSYSSIIQETESACPISLRMMAGWPYTAECETEPMNKKWLVEDDM